MNPEQEPETKKEEIANKRLLRRIERRDRRIAGLERKIQQLEKALAWRTLDLETLSRNVGREVREALCNVRMIPVYGSMGNDKYVDVKITPDDSKLRKKIDRILGYRGGSIDDRTILDKLVSELGGEGSTPPKS